MNKSIVNSYKQGIKDGIKFSKTQSVVEVYAGFVIVLNDIGYTKQEIQTILRNLDNVWSSCVYSDKNIIQLCKDKTGIDLIYKD